MRRIFTLSAVITLSAILAACGNSEIAQQSPQPETIASPTMDSGQVQRTYAETDKYLLLAGTQQRDGARIQDGRLWLRDKQSGQTRLLEDRAQFGRNYLVQGAVLAPQNDFAYAVISVPDAKRGQNDYLVRIALDSNTQQVLGTDRDLGVFLFNGYSLVVSPDGRNIAFKASSFESKAEPSIRRDDPHYAAEGQALHEENYIYELPVTQTLAAQGLTKQSILRKVALDDGQGLMPKYAANGRLSTMTTPATSPTGTELQAQAQAYNLRVPMEINAFFIYRAYNYVTHTGNDAYALDWGRDGNNDGVGDCGYNIVAANRGRITTAKWTDTGYGYYIVLNHDIADGLGGNLQAKTLYAHITDLNKVSLNQVVTPGTVIATLNKTGSGSGNVCHLHFAYRTLSDSPIKPATSLKPMLGMGPTSTPNGSGSCPITGFENANTATFYRYYPC
ncbi:M23 family metallopeptidase (plasmid) [Deinococcus sp. D7000]|nr:M23 family metallopeptidase [Deinococcus sp. D7000]